MGILKNVSASISSPSAIDESAPIWMKRVPLLTGLLAALAGFLTVRGTNLANEAIYHSNQGVLFQAQAADAWAEFQAASVKARVVETALLGTLSPDARSKLDADSQELRERQPQAKSKAEELEKKRDEELKFGMKRLGERDTLGYAGMATQLAIALASVAALTKRRVAFDVAVVIGLFGIVMTGWALGAHFFVKL